jgi:glyoxylase I family protein
MSTPQSTTAVMTRDLGIIGFHGVRYLVTDVKRAIEFYAERLGFAVEHQQLPAFATVALGPLKIHLSGPEASGSRQLSDGGQQSPGGSNRVILRVRDLAQLTATLRNSGISFRNALEIGPAGKQIQIVDPDGNPIELFQPARQSE